MADEGNSPSLIALPTEIVEQIASILTNSGTTLSNPRPSSTDLANLRLTCRTLRDKTTDSFHQCIKSCRWDCCSRESVMRLETFSQSDLARKTRELRFLEPTKEVLFQFDKRYLTRLFSAFPNLKSIEIEPVLNDGRITAVTAEDLLSLSFHGPRRCDLKVAQSSNIVAKVIVSLFDALSVSQAMIERICIGNERRIPLEGPCVGVSSLKRLVRSRYLSFLAEMRSLTLNVSALVEVHELSAQRLPGDECGAMRRLLAAMPKLKQLSITSDSRVAIPLRGILRPSIFSNHFPYLSDIAISGIFAKPHQIAAFILLHNLTLSAVKFDRVATMSPTIEPLLAALNSCPRLRLLLLQRFEYRNGVFTFPLPRLYMFDAEASDLGGEQWQIVKYWPWRVLLDSRTDNVHVELGLIRQAGPNILVHFARREQRERNGWQVMDYPDTAYQYLV